MIKAEPRKGSEASLYFEIGLNLYLKEHYYLKGGVCNIKPLDKYLIFFHIERNSATCEIALSFRVEIWPHWLVWIIWFIQKALDHLWSAQFRKVLRDSFWQFLYMLRIWYSNGHFAMKRSPDPLSHRGTCIFFKLSYTKCPSPFCFRVWNSCLSGTRKKHCWQSPFNFFTRISDGVPCKIKVLESQIIRKAFRVFSDSLEEVRKVVSWIERFWGIRQHLEIWSQHATFAAFWAATRNN